MPGRKTWRSLWLVAVLFPLVLELVGLLLPGDHDVLSHFAIPLLRQNPLVFWSTLAAYVAFTLWLGWHWWFERRKDHGSKG